MDTKQKYETMASRYLNFTETDKKYLHGRLYYYDRSLIENIQGNVIPSEHFIEQAWEYSTLGHDYKKNYAKAMLLMKDETKMLEVFRLMKARKKWYNHNIETLLAHRHARTLTPEIVCIWLRNLDKSFANAFESYLHDPIFKVGQMVQMRSNIGVDAIIRRHTYNSNTTPHWQSVGNRALAKLKEKTYMIIEVDPKTEGRIWANSYSYKEKQGGGRYYKVLPLGDTKTYYVVEKFMKKCRTKAVKDATKK